MTHESGPEEMTVPVVPASPAPGAVDMVNHPPHYSAHPSGVECITIVEHMGFNLGNAIKYIWRADEKGNAPEDLMKALWYVQREIDRRARAINPPRPDPSGPIGRCQSWGRTFNGQTEQCVRILGHDGHCAAEGIQWSTR